MFRRPAPAKRPKEGTAQDVWLKPQKGENEKGARGPGGQHMGPRSKRRRHQARSEKELLAGEQHETSSDHPNPDGGKGTNNRPGNTSPRTWIGPPQALRAVESEPCPGSYPRSLWQATGTEDRNYRTRGGHHAVNHRVVTGFYVLDSPY